jgi:hypothetical protein
VILDFSSFPNILKKETEEVEKQIKYIEDNLITKGVLSKLVKRIEIEQNKK